MTSLEIEAFLAVVRYGNMSAAAENLYITQPALSRRIHALESELGCTLFTRGKGIRSSELTPQGKHFLSLADKWKDLFKETSSICTASYNEPFYLSSIGSVSSFLLPQVIQSFMKHYPEIPLSFYGAHSLEAYSRIANGQLDFALITDSMFHSQVITTPVFQERMVYVSHVPVDGSVSPEQLDPSSEIWLPWYPAFESWHNYWFGNSPCHVYLDQMDLLKYFLRDNCWAIVPVSVSKHLAQTIPVYTSKIKNGPADRIIYSLHRTGNKESIIQLFLNLLKDVLSELPDLDFFF